MIMPSATPINIDEYEPLLVALQSTLGVVVPDGQRSNLLARVEPLLTAFQLSSLADLGGGLKEGRAEIKARVLDVITARRPGWSLNPEMKHVLQDYIISQLPEKARIWTVGCAQGQLAYAVAMEVAEYENKNGQGKSLQIIATDVSHSDVKQAESGKYSAQQLADLTESYKKLYFSVSDAGMSYCIKDKIRQLIQFSQCDLTKDFQSLGKMDLIICPEALVYFSNGVKSSILKQFSALLKPGGIFLTGNNQAIITHAMISDGYGLERAEHPAGVFYRKTI
jgi:chemotaxis methyl-accepting protein methylase